MSKKREMAMSLGIMITKMFYKSDLTAMSQIITAEANKDYTTIKEYLECVIDFCEDIKKNLN